MAKKKLKKSKATKVTKSKKAVLKPLQSTQQNIPIADITNGVIVGKNGKYYKMIEVDPIPFMLKSVSDRNAIWQAFQSVLRVCPDTIHIKSVGLPADLSYQINDARKNIEAETNPDCKMIGTEYILHLKQAERDRMSHKFYIFVPYRPLKRGTQRDMLVEAKANLEGIKQTVASYLGRCGNEVIQYHNATEENYEICKMLYKQYNRSPSDPPFDDRLAEVMKKYKDALHEDNPHVPPLDCIAPKNMSFLDPKYIKIGDVYYSFLYFTSEGFPRYAYAGWLNSFVNSYVGVDVDIFLHREEKGQKRLQMQRAISHAIVSANETVQTTAAGENSSRNYNSAQYMLQGINAGYDPYTCAILITVSGASPYEVFEKIKGLTDEAVAHDMKLYALRFQCEEAFNATLPCGELSSSLLGKMKRNMLTDGAATLYPFTTFELINDDGIDIGDANGSPVVPDFFNRTYFDNPNIFICGKTGAGKSASLMQIAVRARLKHMHVYIIASEKQNEFKRLCANIGGQFITIGAGSRDRINIFDILVPDRKAIRKNRIINGAAGDEDETKSNQISARIAWLQSFFKVYLNDDIGHEEEDILNTAIINIYKAKGIDVNNEDSLWADVWHTKYKEMPIMSDLVEELGRIPGAKRLQMSINTLATGAGSYFNGHTNVDINNEFCVFGLEDNTDQFLGPAIYMALEFTWDKIKSDKTQKKMLIIDEWWRMAFDELAAQRSMKIARLSRALGCATIIATQQMNDVMAFENGKYGKAVINNCATKIIMGLEDEEAKSIRKIIDLTETELSRIKQYSPGSALMIAGTTRISIRFTPTDTEKLLVFNDDETLKRYYEKQQKELMKREKNEAGKNVKSAEEVFGSVAPLDVDDLIPTMGDDEFLMKLYNEAKNKKDTEKGDKTNVGKL